MFEAIFWYIDLQSKMRRYLRKLMTPRLSHHEYSLGKVPTVRKYIALGVVALTSYLFRSSGGTFNFILSFLGYFAIAWIARSLFALVIALVVTPIFALWSPLGQRLRSLTATMSPILRASAAFLIVIAPLGGLSICGAVVGPSAQISATLAITGGLCIFFCLFTIPLIPLAVYLGVKYDFSAEEGHPWLHPIVDICIVIICLMPFIYFPSFADIAIQDANHWLAVIFGICGVATSIALGLWEIRSLSLAGISAGSYRGSTASQRQPGPSPVPPSS